MIKFYQGTYSELSDKNLLNSINNICFVTDRQVLIMGGKEYGKDGGAIKVVEVASTDTTNGATGTRAVADGTLYAFTVDQALYRYNGGSDWTAIIKPTIYSADMVTAAAGATGGKIQWGAKVDDDHNATAGDISTGVNTLENKVATAYKEGTPIAGTDTADNFVVVSKESGINRTNFVLAQDRSKIAVVTDGKGTTERNANTSIPNILVTEKTLAEQTDDILANGLEIRKLSSGDTGYDEGFRSQYALYNKQTGLQLGTQINLVKDQFLKDAKYVIATNVNSKWYEWAGESTSEGWYLNGDTGTTQDGTINVEKNAAHRYLKFTFALTNKTDDGAAVPGETDSVVYIDVNELFDSYDGVSGVTIDAATNKISAQIDATNNETGTHAGSFFNNGANGLYVSGIAKEISGEITDIGGVSKTAGTGYNESTTYANFIHKVGIDPATNQLTAVASSLYADGVEFKGTPNGNSTLLTTAGKALNIAAGGSVGAAISSLAVHIGNLDYSYNGTASRPNDNPAYNNPDNTETVTKFIYAITESDGLISTSAKIVEAKDLAATTYDGTAQALTQEIKTGINGVQPDKTIGQISVLHGAENNKGTLQAALQSIVDSTTNYLAALDLAAQGTSGNVQLVNDAVYSSASQTAPVANTAVQFIEQENGLVNVAMIDLTAQNTRFDGIVGNDDYIQVLGYNVGAALSSISKYIGGLDYTSPSEGTAPASGTANQLSAIGGVTQVNGQVSTTKIALTDATIYQSGITAVDTGAASAVHVGLTQGPLSTALFQLTNIIADYGSFHNAAGNVI